MRLLLAAASINGLKESSERNAKEIVQDFWAAAGKNKLVPLNAIEILYLVCFG